MKIWDLLPLCCTGALRRPECRADVRSQDNDKYELLSGLLWPAAAAEHRDGLGATG